MNEPVYYDFTLLSRPQGNDNIERAKINETKQWSAYSEFPWYGDRTGHRRSGGGREATFLSYLRTMPHSSGESKPRCRTKIMCPGTPAFRSLASHGCLCFATLPADCLLVIARSPQGSSGCVKPKAFGHTFERSLATGFWFFMLCLCYARGTWVMRRQVHIYACPSFETALRT